VRVVAAMGASIKHLIDSNPLGCAFLYWKASMPRTIDRETVQRLVKDESAQLVEVLPREEYDAEHLAGALNITLKELNGQSANRLDRSRPVIVYCNDFT